MELMAMLVQSNFDPKDREIQKLLARTKTGTSTTKDILESAFAHLQGISARHNKNRKMNMHSKWIYATANPYSKASAPQIYPEPSDWLSFSIQDPELIKEFSTLGSVQKETLPEYEYGQDERFPATAHDITRRKWRNAGPSSHHNSAAAMIFMLADVGDDFHNAVHAKWGSLFTVGGIFHHRHKDIYTVSLGFRKWAAVGMKLSVQEVGGEATHITFSKDLCETNWEANFLILRTFCVFAPCCLLSCFKLQFLLGMLLKIRKFPTFFKSPPEVKDQI